MSAAESAGTPGVVHINRFIAGSVEQVWRAWTEPPILKRWFGSDPEGKVLAALVDVRVGGKYSITFANADGSTFTCRGTYGLVEAQRRLAFSWGWADEPQIETLVSVMLTAEKAGTRVLFEHAGLAASKGHDYAAGWARTFDKLARVVETGG
jgi:uncharacterized protein YndB with AHSA1/START domain